MAKQVYPTSEIPHKWAHQAQESARNPGGNLYFRGATIYSYRDSWPLARIYGPKRDGARLVLTNSGRYSVTTATHQHDVNLAVRHLRAIEVPHVQSRLFGDKPSAKEHAANFADIVARADEALKQAQRAMQSQRVSHYRYRAIEALADAQAYSDFFGLRRKVPAFPEAAWNAAAARAERIENPDPASLDKRERAKAARKAAKDARNEYLAEQRRSKQSAKRARDFYRIGAARSSFRLGDAWGEDYEALRSSACMLRAEGEQIETSWGARVPLAAAPMVWNLVQRVRKRGVALTRDKSLRGALVQIGDYPVDHIGADGTLVAGCHTIPYSELSALARALGLDGQS